MPCTVPPEQNKYRICGLEPFADACPVFQFRLFTEEFLPAPHAENRKSDAHPHRHQ